MEPRKSPIIRAMGLVLLLLAVSPATAPFSTCDLIDLFGGAVAPVAAGGTAVQAKASPDDPASEPGSSCGCGVAPLVILRPSPLVDSQTSRSVPLDLPLRI